MDAKLCVVAYRRIIRAGGSLGGRRRWTMKRLAKHLPLRSAANASQADTPSPPQSPQSPKALQ
jgi:hypothetical protein